MIGACEKCGCTAQEAMANAKSLTLQQEFESGAYTCCQLAGWAHEQLTAWLQATQEDAEKALVPVRRAPGLRRA
jgi:hypothetical protein